MAKKSRKPAAASRATGSAVKLNARDKKTLGDLVGLADRIVEDASKSRDPYLDIPARALSNVRYNKSKGFIEMGSNKNRRQLFNLSQAKSYMQTVLVASGCKQLLEQQKSTSIRGLYYLLKHTIDGTREETFDSQDECDPGDRRPGSHAQLAARRAARLCIEPRRAGRPDHADRSTETKSTAPGWVRVATAFPRSSSPRRSSSRRTRPTSFCTSKRTRFGAASTRTSFGASTIAFLRTAAASPPRGVRRLLHRLHNELKLPIYCLLDNDPWGYYIYSVIKQGSINLAYESARMAIPNAKFLGLRSSDYVSCELNPSVRITLNDQDRKRANQIKSYPWFASKKAWQKEIDLMLSNGFKLEVESLISKDISYVTETYTPERLAAKDWLD